MVKIRDQLITLFDFGGKTGPQCPQIPGEDTRQNNGRPTTYSYSYIWSNNGEILATEKSRGGGVDEKFKNPSTD